MAAANVAVQSLTVTKTGNGQVTSSDRLIRCGSACSSGYNQNQAVTLTASASSGSIFTGWGGACGGVALTCVVNVQDATNVTANFAPVFNLSARTSGGKGSVVGTQGINCGNRCSGQIIGGEAGTFTATPDAGYRFVNWSGACSGTAPTCNITAVGITTVQANFVRP